MRRRSRVAYVALALATIAIGLGVHGVGGALGPTLQDVLGDALYAVMMAWWIGAIAPRAPLAVRATVALAVCCGIEVSQLYHTATLDMLRATTLGRLVLGSGFSARDLAAYALGVLTAALAEHFVTRGSEPT